MSVLTAGDHRTPGAEFGSKSSEKRRTMGGRGEDVLPLGIPDKLLWCPTCFKPATSFEYLDVERSACWLRCTKSLEGSCKKSCWIVCLACNRQKGSFTTVAQYLRHVRNCHDSTKHSEEAATKPETGFLQDTDWMEKEKNLDSFRKRDFEGVDIDVGNPKRRATPTINRSSLFAVSTQNAPTERPSMRDNEIDAIRTIASRYKYENVDFFVDELSSPSSGFNRLVANSLTGYKSLGHTLSNDTVDIYKKMTHFCMDLPKSKRDEFATLIGKVVEHTTSEQERDPRNLDSLPTSPALLRSRLFEGHRAIVPNMPKPTPEAVGDHSYLSLIACISDLFWHGFPIDEIPTDFAIPTGIGTSRRATELKREAAMNDAVPLWVVPWSDDFEPNYSTKSNRGSIWIKTVTISAPPAYTNCGSHTYVIALGPKSSSHDEVERKFQLELETLSSGNLVLYLSRQRRFKKVFGRVLASLHDQPERRSRLLLLQGNSR